MLPSWSGHTERKFRRKIERESSYSYRTIFLLALPFFTLFTLLDLLIQPSPIWSITIKIRLITVAALLPLYFTHQKPKAASLIPTLALFVVTLCLSALAYVSTGYKSPYFFGMTILIFLMSQVFLWPPMKIALHALILSSIFIASLFFQARFHFDDLARLAEVIAYLLTTSFISAWGASLSEHLRRQSYTQYLAAEESRDRIAKTVEILQKELQAKSNDPVRLSQELANRKTELQAEVCSEQEAKAQIERALNTRDEFISIASHELKTPITVMKLQSWLLKKYLSQMDVGKTHPGILAFVERNDAQIKRLLRLVEDMLDLSRIRTGTFRLEPEKVEICALVRELVERYQPQFSAAGMKVSVVACEEVAGTWDRMRLEQVFCNIFNNAIKYAPRGPLEIRVSQPSDKEILLEIHDSGPGISLTHQNKIFDRFERAGADQGISGLGLGLYISRQIIRGHGGDIVIAEPSEKGACFKVKLPTAFPSPQTP